MSRSNKTFAVLIAVLAIAAGVRIVYSFTEPAQAPPDGNVNAPINVGLTPQIKEGNLTVNGLAVSGTGNAFLVQNGRVGIGTLDPDWPLEVNGVLGISGQAVLQADGTSITFGDLSGGEGTRELVLRAGDQDRITIKTDGTVGINIADPNSLYKLDVFGKANATELCIAGDCKTTWPAGGGGGVGPGTIGKLSKFTAANTIGDSVVTESGGNIGVGTPSPRGPLHVRGTSLGQETLTIEQNVGGDADPLIVFRNESGELSRISADESADKLILSAGVDAITINSAGSVGVGINDPGAYKLNVAGKANATEVCIVGDCKTAWPAGGVTGTVGTVARFLTANSVGDSTISEANSNVSIQNTTYMNTRGINSNGLIIQNGNVGIGVDPPSAKLEVKAASDNILQLTRDSSPFGPVTFKMGTDGVFIAIAAGQNAIAINASGKVGIYTNNPQEKLHVSNGNLRVDGGVGIGSGVSTINGSQLIIRGAGAGLTIDDPGNSSESITIGQTLIKTSGGSYMGFAVGSNNDKVFITSGGRMGFDDSNPTYRLELPNNSTNGVGRARANAWQTYSSIRWKENVTTLTGALDKIKQLRGVEFDWKKEQGGTHDIGLVAEEVGAVIPEIVSYEENGKDASGLDYGRLTPLLIQAVKEQQGQIEELKKTNQNLEARLKALEETVNGGK